MASSASHISLHSVTAVEVRSNVAATAASVIPFHCTICFDEFDTSDRAPVILPCGHTYICQACSKRLKRCMECRKPLSMTVSLPPPQSSSYSQSQSQYPHLQELPEEPSLPLPVLMQQQQLNNAAIAAGQIPSPQRGRGKQIVRHPASNHNPPYPQPQQQYQVTLPIPKNLVLLAMMEAAELQKARTPDGQYKENAGREELRKQQEESEQAEEIRVVAGMATLAGPCGTYAIRERQGLILLQQDPRLTTPVRMRSSTPLTGTPVNTDVLKESSAPNLSPSLSSTDSFHDHHPDGHALGTPCSRNNSNAVIVIEEHKSVTPPRNTENPLCFRGNAKSGKILPNDGKEVALVYGQKVQVVSFEDGVATLARNQGFVVASHAQLVKVGGPLDESCFLEGLLDTVSAQGRDLQLHVQENYKLEATLQEQVRNVQQKAPTHPVISVAPPLLPQDRTPLTPARTGCTSQISDLHLTTPDYTSIVRLNSLHGSLDNIPALRPSLSAGDHTDSSFLQGSCPPMPGSPASIDNSELIAGVGNRGRSNSTDVNGSSLAEFLSQDNEDTPSSPIVLRPIATTRRQEDERLQRSSSANSAPTWHPQTPRQQQLAAGQSSSFDSVDFRTGLSGHYGLATASRRNFKHSPNTQRQHQQQQQQRVPRMMGVHGGIGGLGARQRASAASYNHWGIASSFQLS